MIKTKFVFAVSLVAMLAVSSAWANDPADTSSTTDTVATEHTVYEDQTPINGAGIAGVSYVNKAVNKAGASAQAAEAHAAAAGQSALDAADSAAEAASSAQSANNALANKQDKSTAVTHTASTAVGSATVPVYVNSSGVATAITSYSGNAASATKATQDGNGKVIADTYATKAQVDSLGDTQSGLVTSVNELTTGKQDALTETGSANRPVYAVDGGVAAVTGMSIPYGAESNPSSWATIWVE